jgi:hypothetical protein
MTSQNPMAPLRRLIDQLLTAADIVAAPLWTVDPEMSVADARDLLAARRFDLAGVASPAVSSFVTRDRLASATNGTVGDWSTPIPASRCIEKGLPLGRLVDSLKLEESVFVLDGDEVRWLVTRADLQAPAFGAAMLSYLVVIEQGLRLLVRHEAGDGWLSKLSLERQSAINNRFESLKLQNQEISIDLCANFSDWLKLAGSLQQIRSRLGFTSVQHWKSDTALFPEARNDVAHGRTLFDGVSFSNGVDRIQSIRTFAETVWSEVDKLDADFDVYADFIIKDEAGQLAGPEADLARFVSSPGFVLTAANPGGVQWSEEMNRMANERLKDLLKRDGSEWSDVDCSALDGSSADKAVLVPNVNKAYICDLARNFDQRAFLEIAGEKLRVLRSVDGEQVRSVLRKRSPEEYRTWQESIEASD